MNRTPTLYFPLPLYFTRGRFQGTRIDTAPTWYLLWVEISPRMPPAERAAATSALGFRTLRADQEWGRQ